MAAIFLKLLTVLLWSSFKFMVGFFFAIGLGFNYLETLITTTCGGMLGVVFYLYVWDLIMLLRNKWFPPKPKTGGIRMSRKKRMMVKLINRFEIYGIVILTPIFLSVPIGTILSSLIEKNKWKIKMMMFFSFVGWASIFYGVYALFGIRLDEVISNMFS